MGDKVQKIGRILAYVLTIGVSLFFFLTMEYTDNMINSEIGYRLCNSIFTGTFADFFQSMDWSYGMTIYSIYAVWSIPIWIVFKVSGIPGGINDYIPVLLWYKLLLVVFAVWSVYLVCKIAQIITDERKEDIILQYISSSVFVFVIFYIVQCDIMGLCFVLLGTYYYMKNKYWRFILFMAIAITMKYFALMVFIPLVLYKEKRIWPILGVLVGGLSFLFLTKYILGFSQTASAVSANEDYYVNKHVALFDGFSIELYGSVTIGLLGVVFFIICFMAYYMRNADGELRNKRTIWLVLAGYMCLSLFYPNNYYWNILMVPFFILLMYCNKKNRKINLILEIVFFTLITVCRMYNANWVFMGEDAFSYLLLKKWGVYADYNLIQYFIDNVLALQLEKHLPILYGILYASGIAYMVINFPRSEKHTDEINAEDKIDIELLKWVKIAILYIFVIVALKSLFLMYDEAMKEMVFGGKAKVDFTDPASDEEGCELIGEVAYIDEGAWMSEEIELRITLGEPLDKDVMISTYGYTVNGNKEVEVYLNDEFVGILKKKDVEANKTLRYYVIPKSYFSEEKVQTIMLKAPTSPVVYHDEELMLSLYMKYIDIKTVEN